MKNHLVPELSDWINKLDSSPELQTLLIRCRKQLIELEKEAGISQDINDYEKKLKEQVASEIQKQKAKLGIK